MHPLDRITKYRLKPINSMAKKAFGIRKDDDENYIKKKKSSLEKKLKNNPKEKTGLNANIRIRKECSKCGKKYIGKRTNLANPICPACKNT